MSEPPDDDRERRLSEAQQRAVRELLRVAPVIDALGERFAAAGFELALVGGPVRDALLGRLGDDLDFTTSALPEQVRALLDGWAEAVWDVGLAFGTVGAQREGYRIEVTTYRTEVYDPSSRKPEVTYGETLEGDLLRRDFTVNAMAVTLPDRRFVDPYGGLTDLAARVLRTPAPPEESLSEDPLRMMRAARFVAQLGLGVAPGVAEAITELAPRLGIVSAERIQAELVKLVCADDPRRGLELMVDTGVAAQVIPELPLLKLEIDEHHRHKDVYEHTLTVVEQAMELEGGPGIPQPDFVLRFAALMHDIGKPRTRRFEEGGGVSFHHHEVVGAKLTRRRMQALRFGNDVTDDVARLVELHLRFHGYGEGEGGWTDSAVRRFVRDAGPLRDRLLALTRADSTTRNPRRAARLSAAVDELEERIERLQEQEELEALRPDLDGRQIMAVLGISPGPAVGEAYRHLLELRIERGPLGEAAAEDELRRWWAARP